jgi:hypothetical protein
MQDMKHRSHGSLTKRTLLFCALLGGIPPLAGAPAEPPKTGAAEAPAAKGEAAAPLVEAFQKGPINISAKVTRAQGRTEQTVLPLFQVPVLDYQDKLDLSFGGEAFDHRVTSADWSVIVVFLPRTIAPTDQGVVDYVLKRKDERMVIPSISVPYDSIPMIFLIPDKNARKKVLKDLNDHLEAFRTLCAKIAAISTERAAADKFVEDLDAIDKSLSPAQYDSALQGFLHAYGDELSGDLQGFLSQPSSNLDKCSFLTQEFRNTNVLVPGSTSAQPAAGPVAMTPGGPAASAYVSILFDLAAIVNNLWPGHQFQYLPAVARDFHDTSADLYYSSWIRTTGDVRGAIMCCPGNWEDQQPPAFDFNLPPGESLLNPQALLKVQPKENSRGPFALFGHDWRLLLSGPKGERLPPIPLALSPGKQSFVASPAPILDALRKLGAAQVQARIVGRWGFTSIGEGPQGLPIACDPAWTPTPEETAAFQIGQACTFHLPAAWAGTVERVSFRPAAAGAAPIAAKLTTAKDGSKQAVFAPKADAAGAGTLEISTFGSGKPTRTLPLTLAAATPEVAGIEARLDETSLVVRGKHLNGIQALEIAGRRFLPATPEAADGPSRGFTSADGKPLEGKVGKPLQVFMVTARGRLAEPCASALLAPRPRLEAVELIPGETKNAGLAITAPIPIASTSDPIQVSLITAKGYRFPADPTFRVAFRNADDPTETRTILPAKIRVMGRDEKATFTLNPADLLGGRAAGKLELQVQDDHAGASDWLALPATFLELPVIAAVQAEPAGFRLTGQSLDQIEAVATSPEGPWQKTAITIQGGREVAELAVPLTRSACYLKLFGWSDLALAVQFPPAPAPAKGDPAPVVPAQTPAAAEAGAQASAKIPAPAPKPGPAEAPPKVVVQSPGPAPKPAPAETQPKP